MPRENLNDLQAFIAVARERSFTRAAAQLGVSPSALSHTLRALETRLGVRLLTRTTRSVSPTEAGERLLRNVAPRFDEIDAELTALRDMHDRPAGSLRITCSEHALQALLWPKLTQLQRQYPEIKVEVSIDYRLIDIVAERFDAGIRYGDQVARDMIAVRIAPDERFLIVGAPAYFARHTAPKTPQALAEHDCINLRLPTRGGLYAWELQKGRRELHVQVDGPLVFNSITPILQATLAGFGLAFLPENMVRAHLDAGRLQSVLEDWCPPFTGYHLYYPNRRQHSRAMTLLVETLRWHG